MDNLSGEAESGGLRLSFDHNLRLEFRGAKIATDAGLPTVRGLGDVLELIETARA